MIYNCCLHRSWPLNVVNPKDLGRGKTTSRGFTTWCSPRMNVIIVLLYAHSWITVLLYILNTKIFKKKQIFNTVIRFPHKNDVRFVFTYQLFCKRAHVLFTYDICVCLRILCCVFVCPCESCVPCVASFHGLSIFLLPLRFSLTFIYFWEVYGLAESCCVVLRLVISYIITINILYSITL